MIIDLLVREIIDFGAPNPVAGHSESPPQFFDLLKIEDYVVSLIRIFSETWFELKLIVAISG
jgi:hypothetical protein